MNPERRKARLIELIARLDGGQDVAPRDLRTVLTKTEYADLESDWESERQNRSHSIEKPAAAVEYERLLHKGQFLLSKSERRDKNGVRFAKKFSDQAEAKFEVALEYLQEASDADPTLQLWFDRPLYFEIDGDMRLDVESMPRVVTSRSPEKQFDGLLAYPRSKRDIKREALERALDALNTEPPPEPEFTERAGDLRAFLRRR
jgi:hypothetical protein